MAKRAAKKTAPAQQVTEAATETKTFRSKVPMDYWKDEPIRQGVYRLHPNQSVEIEGVQYVNRTKETIRIKEGELIPEELWVNQE